MEMTLENESVLEDQQLMNGGLRRLPDALEAALQALPGGVEIDHHAGFA